MIKEVGAGSCSTVWLEVDEDGSERAVKRIPKWIYTRNKIDYKREIAAMAVLSNYEQNFVQFYGWYESPEDVYLAMEYFPLGDLERYMDRQLSKLQIKVIIRQLLKGLCIMHQNGFTHRDLKPQNILVVKDNPDIWVKIGDFGITKRVPQDGTSLRTETGTSGYVAPEVLGYHDQESSKYTNAVDLWSFGCICHRLLTMQPPFENSATMIRYFAGGTKLPIETLRRGNDEEVLFVKRLLTVNPSERYTAERALQSTWFNNPRSREPLHVAQCQSHSREERPRRIKARNYFRPVAGFIGIVMGWWTHSQLLKIGILRVFISILISSYLLVVFAKLFTSSGVPAADAQVLLTPREPFMFMSIGLFVLIPAVSLVVSCYLVISCYLWAQDTQP